MSLRRMANVVSQYYFDAPTAQIIEPALIFGYVGKPGWLTLETKNYVQGVQGLILILQSALTNRNMQVKFGLKVL